MSLAICAAASAAPTTMPSGFGSDGFAYPPAIPANQTSPRTVELLGQALQRAKLQSDQAHFLTELGTTRMKSAVVFVEPFLRNGDATLRAVAVQAAGRIGDPSLAGPVDQLLKDKDPDVRRAAVNASVRLAENETAKARIVARMLKDEQPGVVTEALKFAIPANAPQIAEMLSGAKAPIAVEAIQTLGRLKATEQESAVVPFLGSKDLILKSAAIAVIGEMGDRSQAQTVISFLKDANPTARRAAAMAMMQLADPAQQQKLALELLQNDDDPTVRQAACGAFEHDPLPAAVDVLVQQLYSPYLPLHDAARAALSHSASDAMTQQIIAQAVKLLHEQNQRRKEDGSYLLGHYRSHAAFEDHVALIQTYPQSADSPVDWNLYTQAVRSLGRIGDPKAGPPLIPLLKEAPITMAALMDTKVNLDAEEAALVAIGQMKFAEALPQVWRIVNGSGQEEPPAMRAAAVWALGALTPPDDAKSNEAFTRIIEQYTQNSPGGIFEACKWLGFRHVVSAADALKTAAGAENDPIARYGAHWAYHQITGQSPPYTPPNIAWSPETSIIDLGQGG